MNNALTFFAVLQSRKGVSSLFVLIFPFRTPSKKLGDFSETLFGTTGVAIIVIKLILGGLATMTENEKKMIEKIYEKVTAMEKKVTKLEDSVTKLEGSFKGLRKTYEQGFSDVRNKLDEIIELNNNRKSAREIVEGITGKG